MRVLVIDVGCGTTDILLWDSTAVDENQTHLIVPSATCVVAAEIAAATRARAPVVLEGPLMGGGSNMVAAKLHLAAGLPFYATPTAAASFDDDLRAVAAMGVVVLESGVATGPAFPGVSVDRVHVRSGDVRFADLMRALALVGETGALDGVAIAVQDHGSAPPGVSDRVFRFEKIAAALERSDRLASLFYGRYQIPEHFSRMRSVAGSVDPDVPLVVGDTGPAAVWGASLAASATPCLAINFGNGHTLMAVIDGDRIDGLFEHHTSSLDARRMESYIRRFASGRLTREDVFADGGHGALAPSRPFNLDDIEIVVTGPQRGRFATMTVAQTEASLHGDMMLTGCYGLLQGYLAQGPSRN